MNIFQKIKMLRIEKRLSQQEVADALGMSQAAYSKIENMKNKSITIDKGDKIAQILGVSFNTLFELQHDSDEKLAEHFYKERLMLTQEIEFWRDIVRTQNDTIKLLQSNGVH